jgi:hypothetical protein
MVETVGGSIARAIDATSRAFGMTANAPDSMAGLATSILAGAAAALAVTILLRLYFAGRDRTARDIFKHGVAIACVLGLAAFVAHDIREAALDYLGLNPAKPAVEFEIRLPQSALAAIGRDAQVELHTDRNQTIARVESAAAVDDGRQVLRGSVPLDFRTTDRLVILNLPGQAQHLFKLRLAANPSRSGAFGPWHLADGVVSLMQPAALGRDDRYAIRYRVI